jgi:hypothetical protein
MRSLASFFDRPVIGGHGGAEGGRRVRPYIVDEMRLRHRRAVIGVVREVRRTDVEQLLEIRRRLVRPRSGKRLVADAPVAARDHWIAGADPQLLLQRQGEEFLRGGFRGGDHRRIDAMPNDGEEADLLACARDRAGDRNAAGRVAGEERRDIDDRYGFVAHGCLRLIVLTAASHPFWRKMHRSCHAQAGDLTVSRRRT